MTALIELIKKLLVEGGNVVPEHLRARNSLSEQVVDLATLGLANCVPYEPYPDPVLPPEGEEALKVIVHTEWTMHHPLIESVSVFELFERRMTG